jgi:hypothetical protein
VLSFLNLLLLLAQVSIVRSGDEFRLSGPDLKQQYFDVSTGASPLLGTYRSEGGALVFRPRFGLDPSLTVKARYAAPGEKAVEVVFPGRARAAVGTTVVSGVHPSVERVPANLLKFYVDFSAPMQRGDVWRFIRLLDDQGVAQELPFLEIEQELWDREQKRLTLLFDPGRIKRGVMPREEGGGALEVGKSYTLVLDAAWRDAQGLPLAASYRHRFTVGEEDRTPVQPNRWRITAPKSGTRNPLVIDLGEPLDHALLGRMITVAGVAGQVELSEQDRRWSFVPQTAWKAGEHRLQVDATLEDLAGNKVLRAFDVDVFERVTQSIDIKVFELVFFVKQ